MSDWKIHGHPKFTVIQNKTQIKKNEQPTMGVLPCATQARSKFHLGEPKDITYDEDNDTPCYKRFSQN
jgi:hypothetical protein